ncbi:MAG: ArnT family glycosyltransferase [Armatimonadota bacterium]
MKRESPVPDTSKQSQNDKIAVGDRSYRVTNRWIGFALGVLTFIILLSTASGYGLTYDEPVYTSRAMRAGQWLGLVFTAPSEAFSRETIDRLWDPTGDEQAGLMKLIAWPIASVASTFVGPLAAVRAGTMMVVALLIGCLYVFVANVYGRLEALFAALGLLAIPRVFTHCHLMAMDAPVMAWSALALMSAFVAAFHGEENRKRCWLWIALLGLAFGAAIATKVNGWFIPLIVLPWLFMVRRRAFWAGLVSMAILGPLVFLASWPWLWFDTLPRIARYFSFFGKHYPVAATYFGEVHGVAPWHFPLMMLLITTPIIILALAAMGGARLFCRARARTAPSGPVPLLASQPSPSPKPLKGPDTIRPAVRSASTSHGKSLQQPKAGPIIPGPSIGTVAAPCLTHWQRAALALMVWAVFINLLPSSLPSSPKYNGVRLFLPVFVPLIILAAAGFGWLARSLAARLARSGRETRLMLGLLLIIALAPGLYATTKSYPYGMSYYNALIGGTKGAVARGMEATYWGDTFYAAVPWLNEKAPPNSEIWINVVGYVSTMQMYQSFGALRQDLRITGGDEAFPHADYCVVANKSTEYGKFGQELVSSGKVLYTQDLDSVPLVWIFEGPAVEHR